MVAPAISRAAWSSAIIAVPRIRCCCFFSFSLSLSLPPLYRYFPYPLPRFRHARFFAVARFIRRVARKLWRVCVWWTGISVRRPNDTGEKLLEERGGCNPRDFYSVPFCFSHLRARVNPRIRVHVQRTPPFFFFFFRDSSYIVAKARSMWLQKFSTRSSVSYYLSNFWSFTGV